MTSKNLDGRDKALEVAVSDLRKRYGDGRTCRWKPSPLAPSRWTLRWG
jgi:hypothetical protein